MDRLNGWLSVLNVIIIRPVERIGNHELYTVVYIHRYNYVGADELGKTMRKERIEHEEVWRFVLAGTSCTSATAGNTIDVYCHR